MAGGHEGEQAETNSMINASHKHERIQDTHAVGDSHHTKAFIYMYIIVYNGVCTFLQHCSSAELDTRGGGMARGNQLHQLRVARLCHMTVT